jgi:AraC-like DNA-binding protein
VTASRKISVNATTGLLETVGALGANPDDVLGAAGVRRSVLENPDAFIATSAFTTLLEEASRATGDACFGLHFAERFDPKDVGALAYLIFNSPDIGTAIRNTERYLQLHNNAARVSFSIEGERGYLRYVVADETTRPMRQHNEYSMAVAVKTMRILAAMEWVPLEVQFAHERPASTAEHSRVFTCPIHFGRPMNALVVERELIAKMVCIADDRLYRILKQHADRLIGELPREHDLLSSVKRAIVESMAAGGPKREQVAKGLAMSPRTLERRLKERGVVYKQLVSDVRGQFALDYLKDRQRTITEVAFLLGYSEVSAFNRAFKRWTGFTPMEYRDQSAR